MTVVGFPWADGGSLINTELNDTSSHTTLRLHTCNDYQKIGSTFNGANPDDPSWIRGTDNATYQPLSGMSFILNPNLPATTSWAINVNYDMEHKAVAGSSLFRTYFNGAWWDSAIGSTFEITDTVTAAANEEVYGVGTGTVWLYSAQDFNTDTGSGGCREIQWRFKQARIVPVW